MTVEDAGFISELVASDPQGSDSISEGDDHLRVIKTAVQGTFPNGNAAINGIHTGDLQPTSRSAGQFWFDTTLNVLKIRNEGDLAWVTLGASPVTDFKILGSNTIGWVPPEVDGSPNQFLTTDGSGNLDWASASGDELPSQTGHSGKYLTTNGTSASWASTAASFPVGGIIMWSGAVSAIPSGWAICDGEGDTPDLTGRFVIHADADSGGTHDVNETGDAAATGDHTLTTAQMPSHTHTYYQRGFTAAALAGGSEDYSDDTALYTGGTGPTGGGAVHSHTQSLPPYYALAYIMKTA
jgi:microcystin-dependent protein